jgi:hypothetical protein
MADAWGYVVCDHPYRSKTRIIIETENEEEAVAALIKE